MKKNTLLLLSIIALFISLSQKSKAQCNNTPPDQNFSGYTDDSYSQNNITLNCLKYSINGDGNIGIQDKIAAGIPTPVFSGNILVFASPGTSNNPTQCSFEAVDKAYNFKLKSFNVEFYDHSNGGCPELYNIIGYDNGTETVRVNGFNTKTGGAQGIGNAQITFTKNSYDAYGSTSGLLSFGTSWQNIDKLVFEVAETNPSYKYLFVCIDNIDLENPVNVLPVKLKSFHVYSNHTNVNLNWEISDEIYSKEYVILHSIDGNSYEELNRIPSTNIHKYSSIHKTPSIGVNYYKLVQIDQDGTSHDLEIKTLNFSLNNYQDKIVAFPNPVKNLVNVLVSNKSYHTYQIVNVSGQVVLSNLIAKNHSSTIQIDVSKLSKGTYIVKLIDEFSNVESVKFVKD